MPEDHPWSVRDWIGWQGARVRLALDPARQQERIGAAGSAPPCAVEAPQPEQGCPEACIGSVVAINLPLRQRLLEVPWTARSPIEAQELDADFETLRWFPLPHEIAALT